MCVCVCGMVLGVLVELGESDGVGGERNELPLKIQSFSKEREEKKEEWFGVRMILFVGYYYEGIVCFLSVLFHFTNFFSRCLCFSKNPNQKKKKGGVCLPPKLFSLCLSLEFLYSKDI